MIVIRIKLQVKPENKAEFVTFMAKSVEITNDFDGCLDYGFYEDITDEYAFILYEEWKTQAHFDKYRESEHFQESGKVLFPLMAGKPDSAYYAAELTQ